MKSHSNVELESNHEYSNIIGKRYNGVEEFVRELQVNDGSLSIVLPHNFSQSTREVACEVTTRAHRRQPSAIREK